MFMDVKKRQAELTIAQAIGEVRQLILLRVSSVNPTLSYKRAQEIAEEELQDLFGRLEEAYKDYFSNQFNFYLELSKLIYDNSTSFDFAKNCYTFVK